MNNLKKIYPIIMAIITIITFNLYGLFPSYNIISILLLFILSLFYINNLKYNKQYRFILYISILFSILLVLGNICSYNLYSKDVSILKEFFNPLNLFFIFGFFNLIYSILNFCISRLVKIKIKSDKKIISSKKLFLILFLILIICWLPYLLSLYPGTMSADSMGEFYTAIKGTINSDHHTVLHMLIIIGTHRLANLFTNDLMMSLLIYSIVQMIVMSIILSLSVVFTYNKTKNKYFIIISMLYFGIMPIFGYYSVVMWKDIWYGIFMVLLTICCYNVIYNEDDLKNKDLVLFGLASLLCIFSRNNGLYMYIMVGIASIFCCRKNLKKMGIVFGIVLTVFFIIKYPIYNTLNIERSGSSEYIGIPMQQIGRMAYKEIPFTKKEQEKISEIIDYKVLKEAYNPTVSDGIKFNPNYHRYVFEKDKAGFLKLWLNMIRKHPTIAVESYLISTLGYWYPNLKNSAYENTIIDNNIGLKIKPKGSQAINKYVQFMGNKDLPIISNLWSIGLLVWIVIVSTYILIIRKNKKYVFAYIPIYGNLISILVATPVHNEIRYVFSLYTCFTLLLLMPYFLDKGDNRRWKRKY